MNLWIWDTKKSFICLQTKNLLQITIFKELVDFKIFYRDPNKCSSPLRIPLHGWQKNETICDRRFKKEN